ncbi:T9SS type A sorting domain-containing protein [Telluribacter sp. SYSU D00476]|uniref:T9SS type A sorting domain-containing protein n=1 Tax=Telluribacter sp. SYSU D00476 TaxID=2811430 RepID=UPI001FF4DEAB|nr:T9SS type A sorting domain-containing protein [Telluribacter sp. SYSU D00476]
MKYSLPYRFSKFWYLLALGVLLLAVQVKAQVAYPNELTEANCRAKMIPNRSFTLFQQRINLTLFFPPNNRSLFFQGFSSNLFYIKITRGGTFSMTLDEDDRPRKDNMAYIFWGPFNSLNAENQITNTPYNYNPSAPYVTGSQKTYNFTAATGQYFILMVDNKDDLARTVRMTYTSSNGGTIDDTPAGNTPVITAGPTKNINCTNRTFTLGVTATGATTYQWRKNNTNIPGATGATYTVTNFSSFDAGQYDVLALNGAGCYSVSSALSITTNELTPIAISSQPISRTVCAGQSATFSVSSSTTPVSYQWRKNGVAIPGATSSSYTINSISATHAGDYDVVVTGSCNAVTSTKATLTVRQPVSIQVQPAAQFKCAGEAVTFSVTAQGDGLTYQWRRNGSNIAGATSSTYTLTNVSAGHAGAYDVVVTGTCNSSTSSSASLSIRQPVSIQSQPTAQEKCVGESVTFSVAAQGDGLTYQWRRNGSNIAGATSANYTINTISSNEAGTYDVVVNGNCGNATSTGASLTVKQPVSIQEQPVSQAKCTGEGVTFSVAAQGDGIQYQWFRNGTPLSGAVSNSYTINTVAPGDAGDYSVVINGRCNTVTSSIAKLTIKQPVTIQTQPVTQVKCVGEGITFSVAAQGDGLTYQWRKGGTPITGATSATLTISNLTNSDAGDYDVVITGSCSNLTSNVAGLSIKQPVTIQAQPVAQAKCVGEGVTFTVAAQGDDLTYQWRKGGTNIAGATSATYTLSSVAGPDAGSYDVVVSGYCNSITSAAAALSIRQPVSIQTQPTAQEKCAGEAVTFSVAAQGDGLTYQWRRNGSNIAGATASSYTLPNAALPDAGTYDVVITGSCNEVTSNTATLSFKQPVSIQSHPIAQTKCPGETVTFTVVAQGHGLTYQWQKGGTNIAGATSSTYTISSVAASDAGEYDVLVNGSCNNVTSNKVNLSIRQPVSIQTGPVAQAKCAGESVTFSVAAQGDGLTYQWRRNGNNIAGATAATYTVPNVSAAHAGSYEVVITGHCNSVTSSAAALSLKQPATIQTQPVSQTRCTGEAVTFTVVAVGDGLTYQWRKGGTAIAGATSATYTLPDASASDAGTYDVVVTGNCNVVTSATVSLSFKQPVSILTQPVSQAKCPAEGVTFSVAAQGEGMTYQWRKNGANIAGATSSTFTISTTTLSDAGNYDVVITGSCNAVTSQVAPLSIKQPVSIQTQPGAQTKCPGEAVTFSVTAQGDGLSYQWRKNNIAIAGTTSAAYTISSVGASDAGTYDVVITGSCNTITSSVAVLIINKLASIQTGPVAQNKCVGEAVTFTVAAQGDGLTYQWRKDNVAIAGANAATYTINHVENAHAGSYDVVVTGSCGSVTSNAVSLTIRQPVTIQTQPVAQAQCAGESVTFTVAAQGDGLNYQWRRNGSNIAGATASSYTIGNITAGAIGSYDVVIAGSCNTVTSSAVNLTIRQAVSIQTGPVAQAKCAGESVTFSVAAQGDGLTYQWRRNGANIAGATSSTYTVNSVAAADAGTYDVVVAGTCNSITSSTATLSLKVPISILTGPLTQSKCAGESVTLSVAAQGDGLTYQWRRNGANIAGATSSTYTVSSVAASDAGTYDVVVTGSCNSLTSSTAGLSIKQPATIQGQPVAQSKCPGESVTFSVAALGDGLTYQWRKGGTNLAGATSTSLSLTNLSGADAGNYDVVITGSCSTVTSSVASLTITKPVTVQTHPAAQILCVGEPATFTVAAQGDGLTYQWRKNGAIIAGATTATFTITRVAISDAGTYDVVVGGSCNSVTSNTASLTVRQPVAIQAQPAAQAKCPGEGVTFTVEAQGDGLTYQWRKGGTNIAGATSATYTISSVSNSSAGNYDVVVTGNCNTSTSAIASLTIKQATSIQSQPVAQARCAGDAVTFSVVAQGDGLTYQWRKGGTNLAGATSASYTLSSVTPSDAGMYDVVVTGSCTTVTSSAAALSLKNPVSIQTQPTAQAKCAGEGVTFSVTAQGDGLTYQWRKGGTSIAGATSATYTISSVAASHVGTYDVVTTGSCTTVTSSAATLSLKVPVSIQTQPVAQAKCAGETATFTVVAQGDGLAYQWRKGGIAIAGATSATYTVSSLASADAGVYDVIITGCCNQVTSSAANLTLKVPASIQTGPVAQTKCVGEAVTFSVVAQGDGLTYQWRKNGVSIAGATSASLNLPNLTSTHAGAYDVVLTSSCTTITSAAADLVIKQLVSIQTQPKAQARCAGEAVTFTVAAQGDGLTYQWRKGGTAIAGATSATYTVPGVTPGDEGNYDVVVTGLCNSVISTVAPLKVSQKMVITAVASPVLCYQGSDGSIAVTLTGGLGTRRYQWNNGATVASPKNLKAGTYTLTVTDSLGCQVTASVEVKEPTQVRLTLSSEDVKCYDGRDGKITLSATGGLGEYQYSLNEGTRTHFEGASQHEIKGMASGTYKVYLTDKNSCKTDAVTVTIKQPAKALSVKLIEYNNPKGFGLNDGTIRIEATGGTTGYTTSWTNTKGQAVGAGSTTQQGAGIVNTLTNAGDGTYIIRVTDANYEKAVQKEGCLAELRQTLVEPPKIEISISAKSLISCYGRADGELGVQVKGGVPFTEGASYRLNWMRKAAGTDFQTFTSNSTLVRELTAGWYRCVVTDKNDISRYEDFYLEEPLKLVATASALTDNLCYNDRKGAITVDIKGGVAPFTADWNTGASGLVVNNLRAGKYLAVISDKNGCTTELSARIQEPKALSVSVLEKKNPVCADDCSGAITLTARGGNMPYSYVWSKSGLLGSAVTKLCAGDYTVAVSDANGCTVTSEKVTLTSPPAKTLNISDDRTICQGTSIQLDAGAIGGTGVYQWTLPSGSVSTNPVQTLSEAGTYVVSVIDSLGCKASDQFKVTTLPAQVNPLFAMASSGQVGETIMIVNLTSGSSSSFSWIIPAAARVVSQTNSLLQLTFPKTGKYEVGLRSSNGSCDSEVYKEIVITPSTARLGGEEKAGLTTLVYPNPSQGDFTVTADLGTEKSFILSVVSTQTGRAIYTETFTGESKYRIPVSLPDAAEGMYLIQIKTKTEQKVHKIIIIK